jgi:hypothetical protein
METMLFRVTPLDVVSYATTAVGRCSVDCAPT